MITERWMLPEGIDELLPNQARAVEALRRQLLDTYATWGYELVYPPLIEYVESLSVGTGSELDLQTFKIVDQINGRLMGIRADMTPQVARIDAHSLNKEGVARLCYLGSVLHARPDGFAGSRAPIQIGADIYGHQGIDSDLEVIELMLETLSAANVTNVHMDLGHVGVFRGLAAQAGLSDDQEAALFDMLQRKAKPEIHAYLQSLSLSATDLEMLESLCDLNGDASVLDRAETVLAAADQDVREILTYVRQLADALTSRCPQIVINFDLAELRGYNYHTGVVFAAFVPASGQEIARGGRYDSIGSAFGRMRPATGFSADLKTLMALSASSLPERSLGVFVDLDALASEGVSTEIKALRASGERVLCELSGEVSEQTRAACNRKLVCENKHWKVVKL